MINLRKRRLVSRRGARFFTRRWIRLLTSRNAIAHQVGGQRFYFTSRNSDTRSLNIFKYTRTFPRSIFAGMSRLLRELLAIPFVLSTRQLARGISSVVLARAPRWQWGRNDSEPLRDRDGYTRTTDPSERASRTELSKSGRATYMYVPHYSRGHSHTQASRTHARKVYSHRLSRCIHLAW